MQHQTTSPETRQRSTREVFENHLEKRASGLVEEDIENNYAADVVLLTGLGVYHGHDGVRHAARTLHRYQPDATYTYRTKRVEGEVAFLEWNSQSPKGDVNDGADSFVIRDGKIIAQTIHYTVTSDKQTA